MIKKVNIRCRNIYKIYGNSFLKETIFFELNIKSIEEVLKWYRKNIKYYESRESMERKEIPYVKEDLIKLFLISFISSITKEDKKYEILLEINESNVYLKLPKTNISHIDIIQTDIFKKIWGENNFEPINVLDLYKKELSNNNFEIINGSVYLSYFNIDD